MEDYRLEQTGQEVQNILNGAAMQSDLTAEVERAQGAEGTLQENIDAEETRAKAAEKQNADDIDAIEEKIPNGASAHNKLATEEYVDDSVATNTATFRGTYNLVSDLHLAIDATQQQIATMLGATIDTADNNDYCFVQIPTSAETPTQIARIDRYKFNGTAWAFEYSLNNSGFTAAQWAAINSGITSGAVAKLGDLPTATELTNALAGKQDTLTFDNTPTEGSNNPVKSGGVYAVEAEIQAAIEAILALIPSAATALNQLADKAFVNSSISTNTATFRGTYNLVSDLHLAVDATHAQIATVLASVISTADNNDYAFVQIPTSADTPTEIASTERYKFNGTAWAYEYTLNTSGFTSAQWAAINSGITTLLVTKLTNLPTASELETALNGKQDNLTFDNAPTENSANPVKSGGVYSSIKAITDLIPSEATDQNQLADKLYVLAQILAATPAFKGQFTALADLQAVASKKAGDLGIVRTTDSDGYPVFTFYQYLNSQWNVFFTLAHHNQNKPATTGTTGDYPYNGMGRVVLEKNLVGGVPTLTQDMFKKGPVGSRVDNENTIFVIQYDYVLTANIYIPDNCVLQFEGGSISGAYTITGHDTLVISNNDRIFGLDVTFGGTFKNGFKVSWIDLPSTYDVKTIKSLSSLSSSCNGVVWNVKDVFISYVEGYHITIHKGINDFGDCTFHMLNTTAVEDYLLKYQGELLDFPTTPSSVADCIASTVFKDAAGCIVLEDGTPMTNRSGNYDVYRADIIYVQNNVAFNRPILPYDGDNQTSMSAKYFLADYNGICIKNMNVLREADSTSVYDLMHIQNAYNVSVENVFVYTEETESSLQYDKCTTFTNIYNLSIRDFTLNGGYSDGDVYAYGFILHNTANVSYDNIQCYNRWSPSAGNNVNNLVAKNCTMQRCDVHFYSKDFLFVNCTFLGVGISAGGHFGYIKADSCKFLGDYCVYSDGSYNTTAKYEITLENCVMDGITGIVRWHGGISTRDIIKNGYRPNVTIIGASVYNSVMQIYESLTTGYVDVPVIKLTNVKIKDATTKIDVSTTQYTSAIIHVDGYEDFQINNEYADGANSIFTVTRLSGCSIYISNSTINMYGLRWIKSNGYNNSVVIKNSTVFGLPYQYAADAVETVFENCKIYLQKYTSGSQSYIILTNSVYKNCIFSLLNGEGSVSTSTLYNARFQYCILPSVGNIDIDKNRDVLFNAGTYYNVDAAN